MRTQTQWFKDYSRNKIYNHLFFVLNKIENLRIERQIELLGKKFVQLVGVFPVDEFADTEFFTKNLTIIPGEDFLEIGVGSGVTSIFASLKGAKVVGVDINPIAIENSKRNATLHGLDENQIELYISDVYSNVPNKLFDTIYWNVPFCYSQVKKLTLLQKAVFDYKYQSLENFIENSKNYLKPNGRLIIGFSNYWGLSDKLISILYSSGYSKIKVSEQIYIKWQNISFDLTIYEVTI